MTKAGSPQDKVYCRVLSAPEEAAFVYQLSGVAQTATRTVN